MSRFLDKEFRQVFLAGVVLSLPLAVAAAVVVYKFVNNHH